MQPMLGATETSAPPSRLPEEAPYPAFAPYPGAAESKEAELATRTSPSLGLLCLPFALGLALLGAILVVWYRRRGGFSG